MEAQKKERKKLHASFCFHSGEEEKKLALIQMRTEQPKCITIDLTVILVVKYYSVFQSRKYLMWWSLKEIGNSKHLTFTKSEENR